MLSTLLFIFFNHGRKILKQSLPICFSVKGRLKMKAFPKPIHTQMGGKCLKVILVYEIVLM